MNKKIYFLVLFLLGLFLRIIYSSFSFHTGDLAAWKYIGDSIYKYHISPFLWWSQGPLNFLPVLGFQFLDHVIPHNDYASSVIYHLPFIVGDLFVFLIVYLITSKYSPKEKYTFPLIIWFNILFIYVSSIKGQTEQWMIVFNLLGVYLISKKKYNSGLFILGCGFAVKYLTIFLIPFLIYFIPSKKILKYIFLFILPLILGFFSFHIINLAIFKDANFFRYLFDRRGTIFGSFTPDLGGKIFVGTGMSIWGELYQLTSIGKTTLTQYKSNWLPIFVVFYAFVFLALFILNTKVKLTQIDDKKQFGLLSLLSVNIYAVFLLLYPQMSDHRMLNLIIPLYFVALFFNFNLNYINTVALFFVLGSDIYVKGSYFLLQGVSIPILTLIWIPVVASMFIVSINNFKDALFSIVTIGVFCFMYITGNAVYHYWIWFNNYLFLSIYILFMNVAFYKKIYEK